MIVMSLDVADCWEARQCGLGVYDICRLCEDECYVEKAVDYNRISKATNFFNARCTSLFIALNPSDSQFSNIVI